MEQRHPQKGGKGNKMSAVGKNALKMLFKGLFHFIALFFHYTSSTQRTISKKFMNGLRPRKAWGLRVAPSSFSISLD